MGMRRSLRVFPLWVVVVLALALPACTGGFGTYSAPTAAVVGGTQIPEADVIAELRIVATGQAQAFAGLFQGPDSALKRLDAKRQILSNVIRQQAAIEQAHSLGVSISAAQVQASLDQVRQKFGSQAGLDAQLKKAGITLDDLQGYEELNLTFNAVQAAVEKGVNATPDQIAAAYQSNQATFAAQYHAAHILVCGHADASTGACVTTTADAALAASVDQRAHSGADFGQLAARYSVHAATRNNGGDLGWIDPRSGTIPAPMEQAALALQPGQISQPVSTQFGYDIIKLIAKGRPLADASTEINSQLEQAARTNRFMAWMQDTLARTPIRINPRYGDFDPKTLAVVAPPGAAQPSQGTGAPPGAPTGP